MTTLLITGATRGLGLAAAREAAARGAHVLVAGRSAEAVRATAAEVGGEPVVVDLARLDDVRAVARDLPSVDAVACNAGLQFRDDTNVTPDGFETTFQVNHLAHLLLLDELLRRPQSPQRVVLIGSGTHDADRRTGLPAPLEGGVDAASRLGTAATRGSGPQRYSTSKLLNTATALGLAREHPSVHVSCFDPGLMLDTGLGRELPAVLQRVAAPLAPVAARLAGGFASTSQRSGRALAQLLLDDPAPAGTGAYVEFNLRTRQPSVQARDTAFQDAVLRDSRELLAAAPA